MNTWWLALLPFRAVLFCGTFRKVDKQKGKMSVMCFKQNYYYYSIFNHKVKASGVFPDKNIGVIKEVAAL